MDYIDLLTKIVKESRLTHAEIARRCEDYGVVFDDNYISTIKNRKSPPSADISRAIAKACGRHEDLLVTQAYYDKSPKAFQDMFDSIIKIVKPIVLMALQIKLTDDAMILARQRFDEMAVAEWLETDLSNVAKVAGVFTTPLINSSEFAEVINALFEDNEAEDMCLYIAPDDSMSPTIPEGAEVHTMLVALGDLKDGDFICYSDDNNEEARIRQIRFLDGGREKMLLMPLNGKNYKLETVETSDKRFYEKVRRVIIDFE